MTNNFGLVDRGYGAGGIESVFEEERKEGREVFWDKSWDKYKKRGVKFEEFDKKIENKKDRYRMLTLLL